MNSNTSALIVPPPSSATVAVTNDIRDIKPPVEMPNEWAWVWIVVIALVILATGVFAWFWWRKKRLQIPPVPVVPPHIRARQKLAGAIALLHDPRLFCSLVSDTLRIYLEERFHFRAPERTTDEFLQELHGTALLSADQKQRLAEFLAQCDLVKFARFEPTEQTLRALLDAALRLIDETRYDALASSAPATASVAPPPAPQPEIRSTP